MAALREAARAEKMATPSLRTPRPFLGHPHSGFCGNLSRVDQRVAATSRQTHAPLPRHRYRAPRRASSEDLPMPANVPTPA
jgi:hypothetical protein